MVAGGKSRSGEEEEGGRERDGGEKKKKEERHEFGLQKALVEDAVFRDVVMQATRKWPTVEGREGVPDVRRG